VNETEKKILEDSRKHAASLGLKLNSDEKILGAVIAGLAKNTETKGKAYCPCRPLEADKEKDDKKICPCYWHLEEIKKDGHCKCRLFFRV